MAKPFAEPESNLGYKCPPTNVFVMPACLQVDPSAAGLVEPLAVPESTLGYKCPLTNVLVLPACLQVDPSAAGLVEPLAVPESTLGYKCPLTNVFVLPACLQVDPSAAGLVEPLGNIMKQLIGGGGAAKVNIDKVSKMMMTTAPPFTCVVKPRALLVGVQPKSTLTRWAE